MLIDFAQLYKEDDSRLLPISRRKPPPQGTLSVRAPEGDECGIANIRKLLTNSCIISTDQTFYVDI
jgi:hypothetical protein